MTGLSVHARDTDGTVVGEVSMWDRLDVTVRWRDVGRWVLVSSDPDLVAWLAGDRSRGVIVRRGSTTVLSGPVDFVQRDYDGQAVTVTMAGPDDTTWLASTLAWPKPESAVTAQSTAHDVRTGPAETILLDYVQANLVDRVGVPITVPTSQARGTARTYRARFQTLLEVAQHVCASDADLGFRLVQQADRTVGVDVWQASDLTSQGALLSDLAGTVLGWQYTEQWPTATRVVVGGGDQDVLRMFRQRTDTAAEQTWGRVVEVFQDRRDVDPADTTAAAELNEAGDETLTDGSAAQSFRIRVDDTPGLSYGDTFTVGDLVRAYPAGVQVDDRITRADVQVTRDGEATVLHVGQTDDNPDERVERRARIFDRRIRQLERAY